MAMFSLWIEAMTGMMRAAAETSAAFARAYQAAVSQAVTLGRAEAQALADGGQTALETELHAVESAAESVVFAAEDALAVTVGRAPPLPE